MSCVEFCYLKHDTLLGPVRLRFSSGSGVQVMFGFSYFCFTMMFSPRKRKQRERSLYVRLVSNGCKETRSCLWGSSQNPRSFRDGFFIVGTIWPVRPLITCYTSSQFCSGLFKLSSSEKNKQFMRANIGGRIKLFHLTGAVKQRGLLL